MKGDSLVIKEAYARIRELEASLRVAEDNEEERAGQVVVLDEKVRELEAELAQFKVVVDNRDWWKARAEKAEAAWQDAEKHVIEIAELIEIAERLTREQARFAELEREAEAE